MNPSQMIAQFVTRSAGDVEEQVEAAAAEVVVVAVEVPTGKRVVAGKAVPADPDSGADTQCIEAAE